MGAHSRHKELVAGLAEACGEVVWIGADPGIAGVRCVPARMNARTWIGRNLARRAMSSSLVRELETAGSNDNTVITFSDTGLAVAYWARRRSRVAADFVHFQRADLFAKHSFLLDHERSGWRRARLRLVTAALKRLYAGSAQAGFRFVVQSRAHAGRLAEVAGQCRIDVLPNNCNPGWVKPAPASRGRQTGQLRVLLVSNVYEKAKGIDVACDAMRHLDGGFSLTVVGDGPDLETVRDKAASLPNIHVAGMIPDAASLMPEFDCLLVPTRIDDYPNVVLEGLAQRIPIIASDIEAHREILGADHPLIALDATAFARQIRRLADEPDSGDRLLAIQEPRRELHTFDWVGRAANLLAGADS